MPLHFGNWFQIILANFVCCFVVCYFLFQLAAYYSDEYYNKHSPSKASVLGELKEPSEPLHKKMKLLHNKPKLLDGWRKDCKALKCSKLDLLILTLVHVILIDLHQEALPMIMDVKKNIEEGDLNPTSMAIDHLMLMKINVKMAITVMQRPSYLR